MKINKKGSTRVLVAALGGGAGVYIQKKLLPDSVNDNLKMAAPGLLGLLIVNVSKSPMAEAAALGMAGQTGAAFVEAKVINGVMGPEEEEKILLDAMTQVRGTLDAEEEVQQALVEAAADFSASVAAAADFNASVAGAGVGDYSNSESF